ncbi:sensor histidine kinase [Shouchella hunanensis]|uniref:histidine kinase n=1 Tax=Shouchella hunanensis TaxID=766894 RepID=A0ABY7W0S2_9BACI|nr:histidine kinase [Shouchella hunanensis]WDF02537.1 histidine kinase [Shouchella hunanensis]
MNGWLPICFIVIANGVVVFLDPSLLANAFFWILLGIMIGGVCSEPLWSNGVYLYILLALVTMITFPGEQTWLIVLLLLLLPYFSQIVAKRYNFAFGAILLCSVLLSEGTLSMTTIALFLSFISLYCAVYLNKQIQLNHVNQEQVNTLLYEKRLLKRQLVEEEDTVKQAERTRIARDVHDSVGHQLTALGMQLQMAELQNGIENPYLSEAKQTARQALDEMRKAVRALEMEEIRGVAMILRLIRKLEAESHVHVRLTTEAGALSKGLTNEQSTALYRFVQEGLTNAMRHAYAKQVNVTLSVYADYMYVAILENEAEKKRFHEGFGLTQLRNRFEELDGQFYAHFNEDTFYMKGVFPIDSKTNSAR